MGIESGPSFNPTQKIEKPNLNELTIKNAQLSQELEKVNKDIEDPRFSNYEMDGKNEAITGELGLTLDELTLKKAQLRKAIEENHKAMKAEGNDYEM